MTLTEGRQVEITHDIEPVVEVDQDNVLLRQVHAIIERKLAAGAHGIATAVEPDHDRTLLAVVDTLGPDVQGLAVLILRTVIPVEHESLLVALPAGADRLRRLRTIVQAAAYALPAVRLFRSHETLGLGVGNALESVDTVLDVTGNRTIGSLNEGVGRIDDHGRALVILVAAGRGHQRGCQEKNCFFHIERNKVISACVWLCTGCRAP